MARLKQWIPTEEDYERKVALAEVEVKGQYIATVGDKGRAARSYRIKITMPEGFTNSDVKRLVPRALAADEAKYGDFVALRTFEVQGAPKRIPKKTATLGDFYNDTDKARHDRMRKGRAAWLVQEKSKFMQLHGSLEGFDESTGMPAFSGAMPSESDE